jgi:hypothetical protein
MLVTRSPTLPTRTAPPALPSSPAAVKLLLAATLSLLRTTRGCHPCKQLWWQALWAAACQAMIRWALSYRHSPTHTINVCLYLEQLIMWVIVKVIKPSLLHTTRGCHPCRQLWWRFSVGGCLPSYDQVGIEVLDCTGPASVTPAGWAQLGTVCV